MFQSTSSTILKSLKQCLIISLLSIYPVIGKAQKFEIENKFHIKQDNKSIVFHVLDTDDSQLKKHNPEKIYFWFKSQKILTTQGGSSGSLLNGQYESFYKNNQLAERGVFKKGLKDGIWKFWSEKGILIHQEKWSRGTRTGKQLYYSPEGIIQKTVINKSNRTQIISQDTTIVKTKKTVTTTINDSLGRLISQQRLENGQLDGTQIVAGADGKLVKSTYKKGELVPEKEKKQKDSKTSTENTTTEKKSFKEKMGAFWEKLKFWKKFKKKEKSTEPQADKKSKKAKESGQPKEKQKRKE
ncbi:hypothetical protein D3C87_17010 [compost metagenome]